MTILLSTSVCQHSDQSPRATFEQWRALAEGALSVQGGIDANRTPRFQDELLVAFEEGGQRCGLLVNPLATDRGTAAAPTTSEDRDAQRAARLHLMSSLRRASEHEVASVVLLPGILSLERSIEALTLEFAVGRALPVQRLLQQRASLASRAMDALLNLLDSALEFAARLGVQLLLPCPCPWPHQIPGAMELRGLLREFSGAPLACTYYADWAFCGMVLEQDNELQSTDLARISDACGLTTGLPLGSAELSKEASSPALAASQIEIALCDGCLPAEVQRSLAWLSEKLCQKSDQT